MNTILNFLNRPIVERAGYTFLQAFLGVLLVSGLRLDKVTLAAGIAAGLSALKTFVLQTLESRKA